MNGEKIIVLGTNKSEYFKCYEIDRVALMGASPGGFGTVLSQNAWLPVLRALGMRPWFGGRLLVSGAHHVFNESGEMIDEAAREQLRSFLAGFTGFVQTSSSRAEN